MPLTLLLVLVFLLGALTGLRTLSSPAVVCWGAHLGWLNLSHSPLSFLNSKVSLIIFTLLAVGELIGDKLPSTPSRLQLFPLIARFVAAAMSGAALMITAGESFVTGAIIAGVGALLGALIGYHVRHAITSRLGVPDMPVALVEDLVAIGGGLFLVSRF